jgi:hypothetical protein
VATVGTIFFGALGSGTGSDAYGHAFIVAMAVQASCALLAAVLVSRARERTARAAAPATEAA